MEPSNHLHYTIGIDIGGTFTDVACIDDRGPVTIAKADSTPHDFSEGVIKALKRLAEGLNITLSDMLSQTLVVKHATTVGTNTLINRNGAQVGFLTTKGFEDTTLIMRAIGRVAGLSEEELRHPNLITKPEPLVPVTRIRGVVERVDSQGQILVPIDENQVREVISNLVENEKVEALAVSLLWSFVNPVHEQTIEKIASEIYPNLPITCSYRLSPVIREYARANTVIINAYLHENMHSYIKSLQEILHQHGYQKPLLVMQANGGTVHPEEMDAVATVSSGPSGGVIASRFMGERLKHSNIIAADMGGTSFDVGILTQNMWQFERDPILDRFHVSIPRIDIESIGAGGGTIAWVEETANRLIMGPWSAGADPGPVCYDLGGTKPTVTDANLLLGYIDPDYFLGGRKTLNRARAEQVMSEQIADRLGLDIIEASAAIYDITNAKMADLIRKKVIGTGFLPQHFKLYCYGGAGAIHASEFARPLGIQELCVFPYSSVFSAFGVATSDILHTRSMTHRQLLPGDPEQLNQILSELEETLSNIMGREGFDSEHVQTQRIFHMRYRRQVNELAIEVPLGHYDESKILEIMNDFERIFEETFGKGSGHRALGLELISITVNMTGKTVKPGLVNLTASGPDPSPALRGKREAFFTYPERGWQESNVYEYEKLQPNNVIRGPSIVESPVTTVVIPAKVHAVVDSFGNLTVDLTGGNP